MLFSDYATLGAQDVQGNTALHLACGMQLHRNAISLVRIGHPLFLANEENLTPLDITPTSLVKELLNEIIHAPPTDLVSKYHQKRTVACQLCDAHLNALHICNHCYRACCKECASRSHPLIKFGMTESVRCCDQCIRLLFEA